MQLREGDRARDGSTDRTREPMNKNGIGGGGRVIDYSWAQMLDQARRLATQLQSRGLGRGDQIAMLSKH